MIYSIIFLVSLFAIYKIVIIYYTFKLKKLIKSDRYKKSKYKIKILNGRYVLTSNDRFYVDLWAFYYSWPIGHRNFNDCKGNAVQVYRAFNYHNPIIEEIETLITL